VGNDRKDSDLLGVRPIAPKNAVSLGCVVLSVRAKNLGPINGIEVFHGMGFESWVIRIVGQVPKRFLDLFDQALARSIALNVFDLCFGSIEE